MKLESISIQNLRSLIEPQSFCLRPLTLVVGANSSGKSTFIRAFPLLRQSVEAITRGPILWFGRFVDFGVFKDAVSRDVPKSEIEFGFTITIPKDHSNEGYIYPASSLILLENAEVRVTLVIAEDATTTNTYTKQIRITFGDRTVQMDAEADGKVHSVLVDGHPMESLTADLTLRAGTSLFSVAVSGKPGAPSTAPFIEVSWMRRRQISAFGEQIVDHLKPLFHRRTAREKKAYFVRSLGIGGASSTLDQFKKLAAITKTSTERAKRYRADSPWIKRLQGLVLADRAPELLNQIDAFLSATFSGVSYVGPLRATAQRFYRQQDLGVDEVDPQGANLAMFLMGLSAIDQTAFSDWCQQSIGFSVEAKAVGAHVSIFLRDSKDGDLFNVADMGFGYSQLLPVLATIWRALPSSQSHISASSRIGPRLPRSPHSSESFQKIIVVEQPELHLHPRLQGHLADLLCAIVREDVPSEERVHLVCETHSETIVNQIGQLVSQGRIDRKKVQVLVFEKNNGHAGTNIRTAEYDSDGVLLNWPYGFFLPSEDWSERKAKE